MSAAPTPDLHQSAPDVPEDLAASFERLRRPIMISHVVPDADALGSMLALARATGSDDSRPAVSLPDGSLSQRLSFLFDWASVPIASASDFESADGFIVLDTAKKGRCNVGPALKDGDWFNGRPVLNIDHHASNTRFGDFNWVVATAGSTCELAYYLLRKLDRSMDAVTASLLYAGIQTDTLGFSLPTTTASALAAAADLVSLGANVGELGERLGRSQRASEFALHRIVYANTKVLAGGRFAYSTADYDEIHGAGCSAADIDDQINVPRSLDGVELAILFTEGNRGKTRINFRSSGTVTVVELAAEFKGGGHDQAAGAVLNCSLKEAVERVVPRAMQHLKEHPG